MRTALLERRDAGRHWTGRLSSSALSTATALTALALLKPQGSDSDARRVRHGIQWLLRTGNEDGGWGDTPDSPSNLSTTTLVWASLTFGPAPECTRAAAGAERWITNALGGSFSPAHLAQALSERYGADRTFSVPILTMCAIAGRFGPTRDAWRLIPQLPFELAVLPQQVFGALRLPVVSYALPALISMGLARHRRGPGPRPLRALREGTVSRVLRVLGRLQPRGGGFLEAVPLTSFVLMSLTAAGEPDHPVVHEGLRFLRRSQREDGSWAIDSNLATWATTLAVNALAEGQGLAELSPEERRDLAEWLLAQQWRVRHPYTGAAPGGWAWTDLPGGVPDADDTAGALIALSHLLPHEPRVRQAATLGVQWLLDLQNRDGGMPTFCRGWGTLPFDRSATDLTAHALRAWAAWRDAVAPRQQRAIARATRDALAYLERSQRADGAFIPLWFGNQRHEREENAVIGTARALKGLDVVVSRERRWQVRDRARSWLLSAQNEDGGWGPCRRVRSSIEETSCAMAALAGHTDHAQVRAAVVRGVGWLDEATGGGTRFPAAPIGLYFARLWYSEELYPLIFAASATEALYRAGITAGEP